MSNSNPTTGDVPQPYDVVFTNVWDGAASQNMGFCFLDTLEPSIPFRTHRAIYSSTATFLERTNVSGAYSDNQQDFFLTSSQNDWSGGEGQRFFRLSVDTSVDRYWTGTNIDISTPGQVSIGSATKTSTFAAAVSGVGSNQFSFFAASTSNLYEYDGATFTDRGAHGAGGQPSVIAFDGTYIYLAGSGTSSIRRYDTSGHTFSTFNGTTLNWVTFLNNTLYGTSSSLQYFSTAGVSSTAFTWQNAIGGTLGNTKKIIPYGGKLAALLPVGQNIFGDELWVGDNTGVSRVAELPRAFSARALTQASGIIFIIGAEARDLSGWRTAVYTYVNGTLDKLWASPTYTTATFGGQDIIPFRSGVVFTDIVSNTIKFYDLVSGAVSSVASWTPSVQETYFASAGSVLLMTQNVAATTYLFDTVKASSATVSSSLMDFDNSLTKQFRGVKVDYIAGTDGDGGSVDISYQVDSVDGVYTSLQTAAASGTEYNFTNISGHAISIKITLNKGTSTSGPILKRVYVRAAPILQAYRKRDYIFDLTGIGHYGLRKLRDGSSSPFSGHELAVKLNAAITSSRPFTITDRLGTFTGVCEPDQCELLEVHVGQADPLQSGDFVAKVVVREI